MKNTLFIVCLILVCSTQVYAAGSLTPTNAPAPTMHTLDEIYESVSVSASADPNLVLPLPTATLVEGSDMIHLRLKGETQGDIYGSCKIKGREETTVVEAYVHEVVSPRDAASGLPTGKRQHSPVVITMRIDKSTPLLYNVLVNNENLTEVSFEFWRKTSTGSDQQYFTVDLINASIGGIKMGARDQVEVSFYYQKITWTWVDGGITSEDDWEAPNV